MNTRQKQWLLWVPRVLAIGFILFLAMFALDVFSEYTALGDILVALFMHLIPNFVLLVALLVAWRWKVSGGIVFLLCGLATIFAFNTTEHIISFLIITFPIFVIGALFIVDGLTDGRETMPA